jgi:hypothetical protein
MLSTPRPVDVAGEKEGGHRDGPPFSRGSGVRDLRVTSRPARRAIRANAKASSTAAPPVSLLK